jgi:hypothetical protein
MAAVVLGLLPAVIAKVKGYSFLVWWFLGAAFFIVAFPLTIFMSSDYRKCPFCSEKIKKSAVACRFCQRELTLK